MIDSKSTTLIVFWSWQSDTPSKQNKYFVEKCLELAAKKLDKSEPWIIEVDRDTKKVGGTPVISETILEKIRSCDVFVYDATLVYLRPKPSPNPNVLFELGYALAILGEGRIIGVMNEGVGPSPASLPFDLAHRRWPLRYRLASPSLYERLNREKYDSRKADVRDKLVADLKLAIKMALDEPKSGAIRSDVDLAIARNFWSVVGSQWLQAWFEHTSTNPQYEHHHNVERLDSYVHLSRQAENTFRDDRLKSIHASFISAIQDFQSKRAVEMEPLGLSDRYVISVKNSERYLEDYNERYSRQVTVVLEGLKTVREAWANYVEVLREKYPDLVFE